MMRNNSSTHHRFISPGRLILAAAGAALLCASSPALAKSRSDAKDKSATSENSSNSQDKKGGKKKGKDGAKPELLGSFGDWNAFSVQGKTCYALGAPKERQPKTKVKDTQAYVFISTRPGEGVRNEVAVNLGYQTKDNGNAIADVDGDMFELVTKGMNAWVKNSAKEKEFVESLKGGTKLVVKASSSKGTATTDTYSLKGLSDALARVQQECK